MFEFGEVALVRLDRATEPKFSAPGIRHCKGKEVKILGFNAEVVSVRQTMSKKLWQFWAKLQPLHQPEHGRQSRGKLAMMAFHRKIVVTLGFG